MSDQFELFQPEETLSPRMAWMRKHRVRVYENHEMTIPFIAYLTIGDKDSGLEFYCKAESEDEAIAGVAKRAGVKLWNE